MDKCLEKASELHKHEKYGDNPFIYHIEKVLSIYDGLYGLGIISAHVCAFHDSLESELISEEDLRAWLLQQKGLDEPDVDLYIIPSIIAITKTKKDNRKDYLLKVKQNPLARRVKIADAMCNLRECLKDGNLPRARYYQNTLDILLGF